MNDFLNHAKVYLLFQCQSLIESHGEELLTEYIKGRNVNQICMKLGFCHQHIQILVGDNGCTYGPSYWCQNEKNAEECGVSRNS